MGLHRHRGRSRPAALSWLIAAWMAGVLLLSGAHGAQAAEADFLEPEQAFKLELQATPDQRLALRFVIAPGYHLYRDRISIRVGGQLEAPALLPAGERVFDAGVNQEVQVYRQPVTVTTQARVSQAEPLEVGYQGCADQGLCYPPVTQRYKLMPGPTGLQVQALSDDAPAEGAPVAVSAAAPAQVASASTVALSLAAAPATEEGGFESALRSRSLWRVSGMFLLAGLLLAFTPCVLPMIPILSSIIVGQAGPSSRLRSFSLALAYSLGMALVYTVFGMAAGLLGEGLAGALQNAWVLGGFALLLCALALSMFGVYELQLPQGLQNRLNQWSGGFEGGRVLGVFLMGGLSALIVGPCVAAPLAGALVYISQTRDVVIGGVALFSLASGMSVPLLLVGLSAGTLLPKTGAWMVRVKHVFGFLLLALAAWMVSPVLPHGSLLLLSAALLLVLAVYLGAFERLAEHAGLGVQTAKGLGLLLGVLASFELAGWASGSADLLRPLSALTAPKATEQATAALHFEPVASLSELEQQLQHTTQPVMLDLYADWCVSCKEFESQTLTDPSVRQRLSGLRLLRVDLTHTDAPMQALMKHFNLFGPPALLFFQPAGAEVTQARVVGFEPPERFLTKLDALRLP
jgi:thiol:disulfide interchange protein DsbD